MELVQNPFVSDFTKKTLEQFGWQAGDPIPVELGDYLLKIKEQLPPSTRTDVLIDAGVMHDDQKTEVQQLLQEARAVKAQQNKKTEMAEKLKDLNPNIRDAVADILSVVDDRQDASPQQVPESAPEPAPAVVEPLQPAPQPAPQPEPTPAAVDPTDAPLEATNTLAAAPLAVLPFCPRCGWDMKQKFDVKITDRDKEDFVAVLLGNTRFKKTYELLGGRLLVTLRGLLAEENKLIYRQLVVDQEAKRINTEGEWFAQFMEYRLACSVEKLADKDGRPLQIVPELKDIPFTPNPAHPNDTPVTAIIAYVNDKVLAQEITKRLVGTHLRQFQRLMEALEAMALEPSFWNGIE